MADGIEVPVQVKIHVQEIVKVEFEIQNNVQSIRQCQGPLSLLNDLNLKVKQKINSLRQKVEVGSSTKRHRLLTKKHFEWGSMRLYFPSIRGFLKVQKSHCHLWFPLLPSKKTTELKSTR